MAKMLKEIWKEKILADVRLQGIIASDTDRSIERVKRWLKGNNELLTLEAVQDAIRQYYQLDATEVLTEEVTEPATSHQATAEA